MTVLGLGSWVLALLLAAAQHEAHQAQPPADVQGVEPIRCWRQSSAGAVVIGETFTVTLTCAVFESADAQVVPDESRLNVASIQMAPFEILGGSHPPDVRRDLRRFFQYDYQLRISIRDAIGQDINIPPLSIAYRVHSRVGAAAKLEGRDLSYVLPMMPIRVLSLVPADAGDIRDAAGASLATVSTLRSRGRMFQLAAYGLGALAAVTLLLALVPLARRRAGAAAARDLIPDGAVLDHATRGLDRLRAKVEADGWTDAHVADGLAGIRLIAAVVSGHPISHKPLDAEGRAPEGRWHVGYGVIRPRSVASSSSVTADDVGRAASRTAGSITVTRGHHLEGLHRGLQLFSAALYKQAPARESAELNEAVRHALDVARAVTAERAWWKPWLRR